MSQSAILSNVSSKFSNPLRTLDGSPRAQVPLKELRVLWFNTGTLCNIACMNCYIESSPRNDRLVYLSAAEVSGYLDEIRTQDYPVTTIGFTGGEPFMNPEFMAILEDTLSQDFPVLILTNAMKPMQNKGNALLALHRKYPGQVHLRVSIDHHTRELHETERGPRSWRPMINGLCWLSRYGFHYSLAGRLRWGKNEKDMRAGYQALLDGLGLTLDTSDPASLVLFPEMDPAVDVPEITEACWSILGVDPETVMCSYSRMVVKRRGAEKPTVLACTLIPYDTAFELGTTLRQSACSVRLNHQHCASFCVLGGATCGGGKVDE